MHLQLDPTLLDRIVTSILRGGPPDCAAAASRTLRDLFEPQDLHQAVHGCPPLVPYTSFSNPVQSFFCQAAPLNDLSQILDTHAERTRERLRERMDVATLLSVCPSLTRRLLSTPAIYRLRVLETHFAGPIKDDGRAHLGGLLLDQHRTFVHHFWSSNGEFEEYHMHPALAHLVPQSPFGQLSLLLRNRCTGEREFDSEDDEFGEHMDDEEDGIFAKTDTIKFSKRNRLTLTASAPGGFDPVPYASNGLQDDATEEGEAKWAAFSKGQPWISLATAKDGVLDHVDVRWSNAR